MQMRVSDRARVAVVLAGLAASALALALAPLPLAPDYSWVEHTTSEAAAQGVQGAWLARLGLLTFGLSVLLAASVLREVWGPSATTLHAAFGVLLAASAALAAQSWRTDAAYDATEDTLHSIAATAIGFAFAFGVTAVVVAGRARGSRRVLGAHRAPSGWLAPTSSRSSCRASGAPAVTRR
jgi:hypothetical protein